VTDEIVFDVQGLPVVAQIRSLREVEWRRMQPNFFVVFAPGALEEAPATHVIVSRVASSQQSGELQRAIVEAFPNVSAIDLTLVLQTLDTIFRRVSLAVQFMASFTIVTGMLVLVGAVLTGRYQRIRESILLRSLGASRGQIFRVLLAEYLSLGILAAIVGILLAIGAAWTMTRYIFEIQYSPAAGPLVTAMFVVPLLTGIVGLLTSRGILNHPPLEVLRAD
jgi:putative ABC transport system permease protein